MKSEKKEKKYHYPHWLKYKTIKINNDLHDTIKDFCDSKGLNIYSFTEEALKNHLSKQK